MATVSEKVDKNADNIEKIQHTIKRLEWTSIETEKRLEEQIGRIATKEPRMSTSSSRYGDESPFAAELEVSRRREDSVHAEQYEVARKTANMACRRSSRVDGTSGSDPFHKTETTRGHV